MINIFTEENKGFTIITNFGCDNNCSYCITKNHPILKNQITDLNNIDWTHLEECIKNTSSPKVNLSGGGDPFYNYQNKLDFYYQVYNLCIKYNKLLDIHTRIIPNDIQLIKRFNKIALSIEYNDFKAINNLKSKYNIIKDFTNIRIIQVVNENLTIQDCFNYISTIKNIGINQITFRQMFGNKKAYKHFNYLKNNIIPIKDIMFLKDGEYHNYYFTTNNKLYPYFFGYTEKEREVWKRKYENIEQSCA